MLCRPSLQTPDVTQEEIKKAYYSCMKICHPDLSGNNPDSNDFCMFVNEIYEVLIAVHSS
jgi:DnaJ-class molecular chaperone